MGSNIKGVTSMSCPLSYRPAALYLPLCFPPLGCGLQILLVLLRARFQIAPKRVPFNR